MENLIVLLATSFALRISSLRKFKNYFIRNTGCSVSLLQNFDSCTTAFGDKLYCSKFSEKKVGYGIICIKLKQCYETEEAKELLGNYINKLKGSFSIVHNTGLQNCTGRNPVTTMIDYWRDAEEKDWKVKGYTNGKVMAVLYVKNIGLAETKKQEFFLDSFKFTTTP